jgi:hypothetical protein
MSKIILKTAFVVAVIASGSAYAQTTTANSPTQTSNPSVQGLANQNNLTSTGATVPHPGASEDSVPTLTGRSIHDGNDRVEHSICKNC